MKTILFAAGVAVLAFAAPAFAQDSAAAGPGLSYNFAGPRAEIFGGWEQLRSKYHDDAIGGRDTTKDSGVTGGAQLGYDFAIGNRFVAGPLASIQYSSSKDCTAGNCVKQGRQIEGGARFGMKVGQRALVYGKGAYVNGDFTSRGVNADDTQYIESNAHRDGWRAGAGLEYALTPHAYVKAEYDYTRFNSLNDDQFGGISATRVRFQTNQVLGGFGVRF